MQARHALRQAKTDIAEHAARDAVDAAKRKLGERGPVWWDDGAPDEGGKHPGLTSYAAWWGSLAPVIRAKGDPAK